MRSQPNPGATASSSSSRPTSGLRSRSYSDRPSDPRRREGLPRGGDPVASRARARELRRAEDADPLGVREEPHVRVVVAQEEAMLGERREHAVRLLDAARHEVVDEHAEVSLAAREHERLARRGWRARR